MREPWQSPEPDEWQEPREWYEQVFEGETWKPVTRDMIRREIHPLYEMHRFGKPPADG